MTMRCVPTIATACFERGGAEVGEWGFSSTIERFGAETTADRPRLRRRLQRGQVAAAGPVKDRIAAVSDGFWIRRATFNQLGGFCCEQVIDEDTDLCLRLIACGHCPWYEKEPGTVVYRGYVPANQNGAQLTIATATAALTGLNCYRRTHDRNVGSFSVWSRERWFLCTRFLRRAVKAGFAREAKTFALAQEPMLWSLVLQAFVATKRVSSVKSR